MIHIAPRWAFNAQAIDAAGDPHLAPGIHLRVLPSQLLGLPVAPFLVYRVNLGPFGKLSKLRSDILWIDSRGLRLTPPFDVHPDNPVTGWLPPPSNGVCCWIQVHTVPVDDDRPRFPIPRPPVVAVPRRRPLPPSRPSPRVPPRRSGFEAIAETTLQPRLDPRLFREASSPFRTRTRLRVDAVIGSPRGPAIVASATRPPYQLGASRIERVVLTGRGRVVGATWIDARTLPDLGEPWRLLALPITGGARYIGIPNAETVAMDRVKRGAPLRFGLHDDPTATHAGAAPPATPADEESRVLALTAEVMSWLKRLVDDLGDLPWNLFDAAEVFDEHGRHLGVTRTNLLGAVLQAGLDPGVGRWLGFVETDEAPLSTNPGDVVAYVIRGIWQLDRKRIGTLLQTLPKGSLLNRRTMRRTLASLPRFRGLPRSLRGPFADLWTVACTTIGNPPARPQPPVLGEPEYGPWMPVPPPQAQREIILPASGMPPGAVVALARRKGSSITGLNPKLPSGRAFPLVPAVPDEATSTGTGEFADRQAPAEAISYRAAQTDWFGRWSNWTERAAAAGVRPAPPRPVLNAVYNRPAIPDPMPSGPLSGTLEIRVPVPAPAALPPGARLLAALEVLVDATVTPVPLPTPASPPTELVASVTGPPIDRAGQRTVTVSARWLDNGGVRSVESEPVELELFDPRPPEPVTLPVTLEYAARPDVTGNSRVVLSWTAAPAQKWFRIFYADETRLRARLERIVAEDLPEKPSAESILAALEAASGLADRAGVFVAHKDFWGRELFEQLTGEPIPNPGGTAPVQFEHAVSGSLRVLSFYRVVSVSGSNVEGPFETSPVVAVAVPNTGPPPQPLLTVDPLIDLTAPVPYRARLTVRVPRGLVPAIEYRVRRSVSKSDDPLQMPVVATGSIALPADDTPQEAEIIDAGGSEIEPGGTLRPWTIYHWRVEVRGGPEPGGGPGGTWSVPSTPVSTMLVNPEPPAAATAVTATPVAAGVEIRWEHPEALIGGSVGGYHLDLYRKLPGQPERFLATIPADAPPAAGGRNPDGTGQFHYVDMPDPAEGPIPAGTTYRVIVVDPIGRTSPPSAAATV